MTVIEFDTQGAAKGVKNTGEALNASDTLLPDI